MFISKMANDCLQSFFGRVNMTVDIPIVKYFRVNIFCSYLASLPHDEKSHLNSFALKQTRKHLPTRTVGNDLLLIVDAIKLNTDSY